MTNRPKLFYFVLSGIVTSLFVNPYTGIPMAVLVFASALITFVLMGQVGNILLWVVIYYILIVIAFGIILAALERKRRQRYPLKSTQ